MTDYMNAAQTLIKRLNAPAQMHSVWIRNDLDNDTKEFKRSLCVSIRPEYKARVTIPETHEGIPVVEVPWPKGA